MKRFAKLLTCALLLVAMVLSFVGCEPNPEKLLEKAEKAWDSPYTVEVSFNYDCDDYTMKQALKSLNDMELTMAIDGTDFEAEMNMTASIMGYTIVADIDYVSIGGVLYAKARTSVAGQSNTEMQKATIPQEEQEKLTGDLAGTGDISFSDFETIEMVKTEDGYSITCSGISDSARILLEATTAEQMESVGGDTSITFNDVKLFYTVEDGKITENVLSCEYVMTVGGTSYTFTMRVEMDFDYDDEVKIEKPANHDEYTSVDYEDLMG